MKRRVVTLKTFIVALGAIFLGSLASHAQNTPTLSLAAGKVGITGAQNGTANNFEFYMDPTGYPRALTAGETIFMMGSWPSGNNPTMSDDKGNSWAGVSSCTDSQTTTHGFFYAVNAKAGTSVLTETHTSPIKNTVFDWAHFYNMSITSTGFVSGSSCTTGQTPVNNNVPNITGTAYTTAAGDLILTCVYVEHATFGAPNVISSITFPGGFTGLSDDETYGHSCAYGIAAGGSFTPTFTIAQGTHSTFTIMSAAFKAGTGGSAPVFGASVVLSEMLYVAGLGQTETVHLPCPTNTSAVVLLGDAGDLTSVVDSSSNAWSSVAVPGNFYGPIFYTNNPTISSTNSYTVSMTFLSRSNYDLVGLFCVVGTSGIDTAATTANGSTLVGGGSGATYNTSNISGTTVSNVSSLSTSLPGDLVFDSGAMGVGPVISCLTGKCVFDFVGATNWTAGDNESYANGDLAAHYYAPTAGVVSFDFNLGTGTTSATSGLSLAFKPASGGGGPTPPAPPTGLHATVQ